MIYAPILQTRSFARRLRTPLFVARHTGKAAGLPSMKMGGLCLRPKPDLARSAGNAVPSHQPTEILLQTGAIFVTTQCDDR
jgi:hypothetical protein